MIYNNKLFKKVILDYAEVGDYIMDGFGTLFKIREVLKHVFIVEGYNRDIPKAFTSHVYREQQEYYEWLPKDVDKDKFMSTTELNTYLTSKYGNPAKYETIKKRLKYIAQELEANADDLLHDINEVLNAL